MARPRAASRGLSTSRRSHMHPAAAPTDAIAAVARGDRIRAMKPSVFRSTRLVSLVLVVVLGCHVAGRANAVQPAAPPNTLDDREFWDLSKGSSEPDGYFRSDNLLSNETSFQRIIPELLKTVTSGRVYLGVGPEQNFTYISAI